MDAADGVEDVVATASNHREREIVTEVDAAARRAAVAAADIDGADPLRRSPQGREDRCQCWTKTLT